MSVEKFSSIFVGLDKAYGVYKIEKANTNGKHVGKATLVNKERTKKVWEGHLSGKGMAIGIVPINENSQCKWGCIDIDEYPLDHKKLLDKIREVELPLVMCRSKSGGAHVFLFCKDWMSAKDMQDKLKYIAANLGYGGCEIFPKQITLNLERGDVGNWLNLPYFDAEDGLRYAFLDDGSAATINQFFELYDKYVQTPEQIQAITLDKPEVSIPLKDGPPCLQSLCKSKIGEGGRNNGLFNLGVYLRKAKSDTWETDIQRYNMDYVDPPLPLNEVNLVAKQLEKKEYAYKCKDAPIKDYCNQDLCRTRKYGIDPVLSGSRIANLRKYNSQPPIWFLDIDGKPLELDTEALMSQTAFQKCCIDQLNYMPRSVGKQSWESRINFLLNEMNTTEGSVIEVSQDASVSGQFYDYLEEFCTSFQQATNREEILLKRPYTDSDANTTFFRLKDFENFLRQNKFFEYKSHKIAQRLREANGKATQIKIKNKAVRVWELPAFGNRDIVIDTPDLGGDESEVPF